MKEALLYHMFDNATVKYNLCAHHCVVYPGKSSICKVRQNINGIFRTKVYGSTIAKNISAQISKFQNK